MKNGFRSQPQPNKKQAQQKTDTELQNLNMSVRISQLMIQQLVQNVKKMGDDLSSALNQLYELQYKYLAVQKTLNLDVDALNIIANEQRLLDFNEASTKADIQEKLETASVVEENSTVVITSTAKDSNGEDRGIFRSRLKLSESGVPELITNLTGKTVGDKVQVTLNGLLHDIEVLSIRNSTIDEAQESANETTH